MTRKIGDKLNLEADVVGKYLYNFFQRSLNGESNEVGSTNKGSTGITMELLVNNGFGI